MNIMFDSHESEPNISRQLVQWIARIQCNINNCCPQGADRYCSNHIQSILKTTRSKYLLAFVTKVF